MAFAELNILFTFFWVIKSCHYFLSISVANFKLWIQAYDAFISHVQDNACIYASHSTFLWCQISRFLRKIYFLWKSLSLSLSAFSFAPLHFWVNDYCASGFSACGGKHKDYITWVVLGHNCYMTLLLPASKFCYIMCFAVLCRTNGKHWFTQQESPHNKEGESLSPKSSWTESWLLMLTGLNTQLSNMESFRLEPWRSWRPQANRHGVGGYLIVMM